MSSNGGGGSNLLDMGLMVAAGVAAPELAAEIAPEMMAAGGASGAAVGAATGAGLSGLTAAATGQDPLKAALIGGVGGAFTGYMPDVATPAVSGATDVSGQIGQSIQAMTQAGATTDQVAQSLMDNYGMTGAQAAQAMNQVASIGSTAGGIGMQGANLVDQTAGIQSNIGLPQTPYAPPAPTVNPTTNMFGQFAGPTNSQLYLSGGINALGGLSQRPAGAYTPPGAIYKGGALQDFHYSPFTYSPDVVRPPNPTYQANYSGMAKSSTMPMPMAEGGITSLRRGGIAHYDGGGPIPQSMANQAVKQILEQNGRSIPTSSLTSSNPNQFSTAIAPPAGYTMNAYGEYVPTQSSNMTDFMSMYGPEMMQIIGRNGMAKGGITNGGISDLGSYSDGGRLLKGPGDGMSDDIPAKIGGKQEARLADGEFVVPADVVSGLGNGSTDAGAKHLYKMMDKVRHARTGRKSQAKQIKSEKYVPA